MAYVAEGGVLATGIAEAVNFRRLVDYPYAVVRVKCRFCPGYLRGYRLARLAARLGADMDMHALLDLLECGRGRPHKLRKLQQFCGMLFADLWAEPLLTGAPAGTRERLLFDEGEGG